MLKRKVRNTTQQLEIENQKLRARVKLLEDITRSMAHNSRGAAAGIKMMNDLLIEKSKTGFNEEVYSSLPTPKILDCIGNSSNALLNTLHDMMEIVNQDMNDDLHYVDCDIKEISDGVVDQLGGAIIQKHAKLVFNFAIDHFRYAKTYLESMLYNLVSNALKYSRPDVDPEITISSSVVDGHPVLAVADNGLGIDLDRYGDKMFTLNQTFHKGYDSKGIGLFITKGQIESLGGNIAVESEVGKGTTFVVTL